MTSGGPRRAVPRLLALSALGIGLSSAACAVLLGLDDVRYAADASDEQTIVSDAPAESAADGGSDGGPIDDLCPDDSDNDAGVDDAGSADCGEPAPTILQSNPQHCGACFRSCAPQDCAGTECAFEVVFTTSDRPFAGVDARYAYSYRQGGAGVGRVARVPASPDAGVADAGEILYGVDAGNLYSAYLDPRDGLYATTDDGILSLGTDGTPRSRFAAGNAVSSMVTDDTHVYFVRSTTPTLQRVDKDGGGRTPWADTTNVQGLAADAFGQAWVDERIVDAGVSVRQLFVRPQGGAASAPIELLDRNAGAAGRYAAPLALSHRYVYFVDQGALYRARRDSPTPKPIRTGSWPGMYAQNAGLALVGDYVYWVHSAGATTLLRTHRCGGPTLRIGSPNVLDTGPVSANGYLYYAQVNGAAGIHRVRP